MNRRLGAVALVIACINGFVTGVAAADLMVNLQSPTSAASVNLGNGTIDANTLRIRRRPEILTAEWDNLLDESVSGNVQNPLYDQNGNAGANPLYGARELRVTIGPGGMHYLHQSGVIHRDLAARLFLTIPGQATPIAMADLLFTLADIPEPGSTINPGPEFLMGDWQATQSGTAYFTSLDGTPLERPLSISGASWSFTVVPAPGAGLLVSICTLCGAGFRNPRRR